MLLLTRYLRYQTLLQRQGTWQYVSIRMLREANGQTGKATFQDEMESLLYVVLYCALIWQRHKVSMKQLTSTITELFDSFTEFEAGIKDGGDGKIVNAEHRVYTRSARFENQDLSEWLNTVMDFHSPRPHQQVEYKDKWSDPEQLDAYWSNFLQTHTLDRDNRADNKLDHYDLYDSITPPPPSPYYVEPRKLSKTPPPFPRRKRKIEESPGDSSGSQPKQARTEPLISVQLDSVRTASPQSFSPQPAPVHPAAEVSSPVQPIVADALQSASAKTTSVLPAAAVVQPALVAPSQDPTPPIALRRSPRKHASSMPKPAVSGSKSRKTRTTGPSPKPRRK